MDMSNEQALPMISNTVSISGSWFRSFRLQGGSYNMAHLYTITTLFISNINQYILPRLHPPTVRPYFSGRTDSILNSYILELNKKVTR